MKTLWNEAHRAEVLQRIEAVTPQRAPNWGRMDAARMVAHVGDWFRMALGELPIAERWLPIRYFPLKQLVIFVLPFPKNMPTAPELQRQTLSLDEELASLRSSVERFAARDVNETWNVHPAFGPLSGSTWGALGYKHTDHHLRQFGL